MKTIHGEPSFHLATPEVDLSVTARGGHMAPVVFHLSGRDVSPYSLAPWEPGEHPDQPPLLSMLRGDFFCLPFGGQPNGPPHGETANKVWQEIDSNERSIRLRIACSDTGASVEKSLAIHPGHHAVYLENRISGLAGNFNYGTHPILDFSGVRSGRVTTSPFRWASVYPGNFSDPAAGESQCLAPGGRFTDLREVPLTGGGITDLTRYPARTGNDDLVMLTHVCATPEQPFAWTAAVLDGFVWFSLKNPSDFPSTLLWLSNGGRSAPPWNSRHTARLGIEDVCSHFCDGVEISRRDLLADESIPTTRPFSPEQTVALRAIHAVAAWPTENGAITSICQAGDHSIRLTGETGAQSVVPLDWKFLLKS
jgi:hypothetical protein